QTSKDGAPRSAARVAAARKGRFLRMLWSIVLPPRGRWPKNPIIISCLADIMPLLRRRTCGAIASSLRPPYLQASTQRDRGPQPMGGSLQPPCLQSFNTEVTEILRALRVEGLTVAEYTESRAWR